VVAGVGGVIVDFEEHFDDTGGLALLLSGRLGVDIDDRLLVYGGGGMYRWGLPGETIAEGGLVEFGFGYRF
jgi:hypothetical protein